MTDYIAYILQEQEEQEERRAESDWRKAWEETALPILDRKELEDLDGTAGGAAEGGTAAGGAVAGEVTQADTADAVRLLAEEGFGRSTSMLEEVDGAAKVLTGAGWVYQALRQSLTELPAARRESRVVTLQKPGEKIQSGGWDAAGLDRLVRRDARRFDGGFQLL